MHRQVPAIAARLSLRPPQRRSLEILDRVVEIARPRKDADMESALAVLKSEFPTVSSFERDFPSICFALATGVGKTRLMGAFVSYLYFAHGFKNFFVLAPNLTIYNKLITDFSPNTRKYVFQGIGEFVTDPPPSSRETTTSKAEAFGVGSFSSPTSTSTSSTFPRSTPKSVAAKLHASNA